MHAPVDTDARSACPADRRPFRSLPSSSWSEELTAVVRRAAAGDQAAWKAIVDEYGGLLWSVVRGFRLGEAQAADAVQTTWLRLVEHLAAIRDPARLAGWLRTTARRVCLEILRESGREQPTDLSTDPWEAARAGCVAADDTGAPESCALRHEREALVRRVVTTLPDRQQALLGLLVASPPLRYEEISARLDMPVGSIGPTRARILSRLRSELQTAEFCDLAVG